MVFTELGTIIVFSCQQDSNALFPILVTEFGIFIVVSLLHP